MASSAARARMINELNRPRVSSPHLDEFATAHSTNSFDVANEAIHSTIQFDNGTDQHPLPRPTFDDTVTDMSVEFGRGAKSARHLDNDVSSSFRFKMGDDSIYSLTTTPPFPPQDSQRRSSKKEANIGSTRDAPQKRQRSTGKPRSLSEAIQRMDEEANVSHNARDFAVLNAPTRTRNSRFPSRRVSADADNRNKAPNDNNATASWTAQTAHSFALPDMSNIVELLDDKSRNATPAVIRGAKRSRFNSATYKPNATHAGIATVPLPEDEKAIYNSLLLLRERIAQLEIDKSEAQKNGLEQKSEIARLANEVSRERRLRKADSALGSDDDCNTEDHWRVEKAKMQATIKSLQERLDKADRKVSNSEIAVKRMTRERDNIMSRFTVESEELKAENQEFREAFGTLSAQQEDLQQEVQQLYSENEELRMQLALATAREATEAKHRNVHVSGESHPKIDRDGAVDAGLTDQFSHLDISGNVQHEINTEKGKDGRPGVRRQEVNTKATALEKVPPGFVELVVRLWTDAQASMQNMRSKPDESQALGNNKSRNHTQTREATITIGGSTPLNTQDDNSTQMSLTRHARDTLGRMYLPSPGKATRNKQEDTHDVTHLTDIDINLIDTVRKTIEEERKASGQRRQFPSASLVYEQTGTSHSVGNDPTRTKRKPSLKDVTGGENADTRRSDLGANNFHEASKAAKIVRVQSPQVSDKGDEHCEVINAGDSSVISNSGRRRRRTTTYTDDDGETSAFIVPDITLHTSTPAPKLRQLESSHDSKTCTQCPHDSTTVDIPIQVPVLQKTSDDVTEPTIRPVLSPAEALGRVLKQLQDEVIHLKLLKAEQDRAYNQHDPALSRRRRASIYAKIQDFCKEIERKSQQIYDLNDVLCERVNQLDEGGGCKRSVALMTEEDVEETLQSIGIDPVQLSGKIGRGLANGVEEAGHYEESDDGDMPWEGLSDIED